MSNDTQLKHAKLTVTLPQPDGSAQIITKSYFEELDAEKVEIQKTIITSRPTLMTDVIQCLEAITKDGGKELSIVIKDTPTKMTITKTWTIRKEKYR